MALSADTGIDAFRASFGGRVFVSGDSDYDSHRSVWNGAIDRRPLAIAHCQNAAHVADAIRYARARRLEIAVRGGGHNYAGHAVCDAGMMIHLGAMNGVIVDPKARRMVCRGGATWADVDAATQQHGLAVPGGFISHTGVAGLALGGGIGWLTKKAGLTCDNLIAAEIVTADSSVLHVSKDEHPDLFWALRGGGGNFGVVTTFEFALHHGGPMVNIALFFWGLADGAGALAYSRDFIQTLPDNAAGFLGVALSAPPAPFVPEQYRFAPGNALLVAGLGSPEEHAAIVAPVRAARPPLFELVTPIPYVALQQMSNDGAPWGVYGYEKSLYLDQLSDAAIATISEHAPKKKSPLSFCPTFALAGAFGALGDADTAFGGSRSASYVFNIAGHGPTRELYEADREWVRNFWDAMRPHASGAGGYVNFMTDPDEERVRAAYGDAKYERLARLKAEYDPDNVFHLNANIRPASR
jgi:FAD/FMN-containing dehydrogenase